MKRAKEIPYIELSFLGTEEEDPFAKMRAYLGEPSKMLAAGIRADWCHAIAKWRDVEIKKAVVEERKRCAKKLKDDAAAFDRGHESMGNGGCGKSVAQALRMAAKEIHRS